MIVIGADSHKRSHTVVAVDEVGRRLGERTVKATSDGHLELLLVASWPQVTFALEDWTPDPPAGSRPAGSGQPVVRVPTRLMAATRQRRPPPRQVGPDRRRGGRAGRAAPP